MSARRPLRLSAALVAVLTAGPVAAQTGPDDPYFSSRGSWNQDYDDQWALKRIGFGKDGGKSAWDIAGKTQPVIVAVIDSGIDYFHPDIGAANIWRNPKEVLNGEDDDGNGYVDDVIGWNFVEEDNNPWDWTGHGTHVAGVIAATIGNGEGIAGVNPHAVIMPLRVMNTIGRGYSTRISQAIYYAVENGARVINLSFSVPKLSRVERRAIDYANEHGVVVIAASGNDGKDAAGYGPAGFDNVITVAATDTSDRRLGFSNFGTPIDIAAPGLDVLSLRARRTDFALVAGLKNYKRGRFFVGKEARYYRASGTSFAAPFVSGVASLLIGRNPDLKPADIRRILRHSARDIGDPGTDLETGYGLLDARAALAADPTFFVEARILGLSVVKANGAVFVRVGGIADADRLEGAWIELGKGEKPESWQKVSGTIDRPVNGGTLYDVPAQKLAGSKVWTVRLVVRHANGRQREARFVLRLG